MIIAFKYSCLAPLYAGTDNGRFCAGILKATSPNDTKQNSTYDWLGDNAHDFHDVNKDNRPDKNDDNLDFIYDRVITGETNEPEVAADEENDAVSEELHLNESKEDDFEIFNLRIIHRKNRSVSHWFHLVLMNV